MRDTDNTEKNVRATRCCVFRSVMAAHGRLSGDEPGDTSMRELAARPKEAPPSLEARGLAAHESTHAQLESNTCALAATRHVHDTRPRRLIMTEDYCRYLDSIATINISDTATRSERSRYHNYLTLGVTDEGPKPGPIKHRPDFSRAVHACSFFHIKRERRTRTFRKTCENNNVPLKEYIGTSL